MNSRSALTRVLIVLVIGTLAIGLGSCGKDKTAVAPKGSTITFDPSEQKYKVGVGTCTGAAWLNNAPFLITLLDPQLQPMNDTTITIFLQFAPGSITPGSEVMQLYDAETSQPVPTNPWTTKTGPSGTKSVFVRSDYGGCTYRGLITATSGNAFGMAAIEFANN